MRATLRERRGGEQGKIRSDDVWEEDWKRSAKRSALLCARSGSDEEITRRDLALVEFSSLNDCLASRLCRESCGRWSFARLRSSTSSSGRYESHRVSLRS